MVRRDSVEPILSALMFSNPAAGILPTDLILHQV